MTYSVGALSYADGFGNSRLSRSEAQRVIRGAIVFCLAVMVATWVIAAIKGSGSEPVPISPQRLAVAAAPPSVIYALGLDPVFIDPGATSVFTHGALPSPSSGAFQIASSQIASPQIASPQVADASPRPPATSATPVNIPLPPVRTVPVVVASVVPPLVHEVPAFEADVPLPPVRAVPVVVASVAPAPVRDLPVPAVVAEVPLPPLPPSRPAIEPPAIPRAPRVAAAHTAPEAIAADFAPPARDNRNFVQKLLNLPAQTSGPVLAYARPDEDGIGNVPNYARPAIPPMADARTAIYDISAHTVYLPDGEQLEAHSGLGSRIDDPGHVSEKDRGATPPHVYDLQLREQLFHGVRALRLNPVGGGSMYGRVGLLAHTFMLGGSGQSNGCVSFRDYQKFLQAYLRGNVTRLVVVAHRA